MKTDNNPILKLTIDFAVEIVDYTERLRKADRDNIADQLFRAATSIGANAMEAQNAESRKDFIHKIKISAKEAGETDYWLTLCSRSKHLPDPGKLSERIDEINRVLGKIISSAKKGG